MPKRISPQFFICLMTAVGSVTGSKGKDDNMACVNEPEWHTAFTGDSVRINCTYRPTGESSVKHFYRENPDSGGTDLISTHTSHKTMKDRFSLTDHKEQGVYTVMIFGLRQEDTGRYRCAKRTVNDNFTCLTLIHLHIVDTNKTPKGTHTDEAAQIEYNKRADSGTYWCGSDRKWHNASYTKINLFIDERHIKTKKSGPQQTTAAPSSTTTLHDPSFSGRIIGATVACLALLVTVGIVLIVFIPKLCRTQEGSTMQSANVGRNSEENHNDRVYEDIKELSQGPSSGDQTLSAYAFVELPAEQLHYASVSFQQEAVTVSTDRNPHPDTDQNVSLACEYSSVRKTQDGTHPPTLYSTVKNPEELS
ncbi:unnamed protein product [Pleuronectes platessa]|uniref:Immunoglobulin subtype domain-containing protein n=1 Tax=Pleuronectes platessa TaxID=8262 RepID=A0A9N7V564_PLEPL|nr:unnamed protein product [Pleuronectes platessa]